MKEIQHALGILSIYEDRDTDDNSSEILHEDELPTEDSIIRCCLGLLKHEGNKIRASHHTATEYFREEYGTWFPDGHAILSIACCKYLSQKVLLEEFANYQPLRDEDHGPTRFCDTNRNRWRQRFCNTTYHSTASKLGEALDTQRYFVEKHAFFRYAAIFWGVHFWEAFQGKYFHSERQTSIFTHACPTTEIYAVAGEHTEIAKLWNERIFRSPQSLESLWRHEASVLVRTIQAASRALHPLKQEVNGSTSDEITWNLLFKAIENHDEGAVMFLLTLPGLYCEKSRSRIDGMLEKAIMLGYADVAQRLLSLVYMCGIKSQKGWNPELSALELKALRNFQVKSLYAYLGRDKLCTPHHFKIMSFDTQWWYKPTKDRKKVFEDLLAITRLSDPQDGLKFLLDLVAELNRRSLRSYQPQYLDFVAGFIRNNFDMSAIDPHNTIEMSARYGLNVPIQYLTRDINHSNINPEVMWSTAQSALDNGEYYTFFLLLPFVAIESKISLRPLSLGPKHDFPKPLRKRPLGNALTVLLSYTGPGHLGLATDANNRTALSWLMSNDILSTKYLKDLIDLLLGDKYKTEIDYQDEHGKSALSYAAQREALLERDGCILQKLEAGASPNVRDEQGMTPILYVAAARIRSITGGLIHVECFRSLCNFGADVNDKNGRGVAVLDFLVHGRVFDHHEGRNFAEMLLENGMRTGLQSMPLLSIAQQWSYTPASLFQYEAMMQRIFWVLVEKADPDVQNKEGKTLLELAETSASDEFQLMVGFSVLVKNVTKEPLAGM
ncbi:nacht and ankyrin domain protein [Colletotrichum asianum]|uniref:Nacht and ankyrin domain protein n=1 Tax=Colletotrichum asianum TaxID=702518 RepID=A0A8H3WRR3_9PEZI|nr:nacht and ankyrin domain protein [Colletotrichum asianum]